MEALETTRDGKPSPFACPDCHGVLWEVEEGDLLRFRCRVGHAFSPESLLASQSSNLEEALWVALRALEETAALAERLQERATEPQATRWPRRGSASRRRTRISGRRSSGRPCSAARSSRSPARRSSKKIRSARRPQIPTLTR